MSKRLFLALLLVPSIILPFSFRTTISATDAGTTANATFGVDPAATNGLDATLDILYIPIPVFAIYFDEDWGITMITDIRSDRDSLQVWKLAIAMPSALTISILWSISDLPDSGTIRCGELTAGDDSVSVWNNMRAIDHIDINSLSNLIIEFRPPPREPTGDTIPPVAVDWLPIPYSSDISGSTSVAVSIVDSTSDVDSSSVHLRVDGTDITFLASFARITNGYRIAYDPFIAFSPGTVWVTIEASDRAFPSNTLTDTVWFIVRADTTGFIVDGRITLSGASDHSGSIVILDTIGTDTTDTGGYFIFRGVPPGFYLLKAIHDGYITDSTFITVIMGDTTINLTLLPSGGFLDALVLPSAPEMSIFPNPFNKDAVLKVIVPTPAAAAALHISDIVGKTITETNIYLHTGENTILLNLPDYAPSGIYRIALKINGMDIKTKAVYIR